MAQTTSDLRGQDIIDSRDVIARIEHLSSLRQEALDRAEEARKRITELEEKGELSEEDSDEKANLELGLWTAQDGSEFDETSDWTEDEYDELKALESLRDAGEGCSDWQYGAGIIKDSYFTDYAQQTAEDIGAISRDAQWPLNHIDWEAAAEELKTDYTEVEFDGETYWIRD